MVTITRENLAEALSGFRLLKRQKRGSKQPPDLAVTVEQRALCLSAIYADHTLVYRTGRPEGCGEVQPFAVPMSALEGAVKAADKAGVIALEPVSVRYQVKGLDVSAEFFKPSAEPQIPEGSGSVQTIAIGAEIWEAIAEASLCASTDEARYILNGVHLGRERVAATDGRRLYMHTLPSPLPFDEEGIILPLHPLYRLFSNIGEARLDLGAVPKEEGLSRRFTIGGGPWTWSGFLIAGKYPNYRQVIPKESEDRRRILLAAQDADRLIDILPKLPEARESSAPVRLEWDSAGARLVAGTNGSRTEVVLASSQIQGDGAPGTVSFNRDFLVGALRQGFRVLSVRDRFAPVAMTDEERCRLHLWMPLRIDETDESVMPSEETASSPAAPPAPASSEPKTTTMTASTGHHRLQNAGAGQGPAPSANGRTSHGNGVNGNGTKASETERDPVDLLLDEIQGVRDSLRESAARVSGLAPLVRQVARENRARGRELARARSSFASLQRSVKVLQELEA